MFENTEKSIGHVAFIGECEYYIERGELYRAPITNPVQASVSRCGRWECSQGMTRMALSIAVKAAIRIQAPIALCAAYADLALPTVPVEGTSYNQREMVLAY